MLEITLAPSGQRRMTFIMQCFHLSAHRTGMATIWTLCGTQ
jgi:hypothetical protein